MFYRLFVVAGTALLLASFGCSAASSGDYTELEWSQLIPEGWQRPLIAPAPDEEHAHHIDQDSLNLTLAALRVKLPGYMKPVKFTKNLVAEFLLVPYLDQHVKRHSHLDANQMVYVKLDDPVVVENPYRPYFVTGTMSIATVVTADGPTGYTISGAVIEPYVY